LANSLASMDALSDDHRGISPLLEISNAMVRLYKEAFGRGPTKSRVHFAGADTLLVTLEDSMTVAERSLALLGGHEQVREARMFIQYALEDQFRAIVERTLQRRTVAFVSGVDTRHDICVKVFTLESSTDSEPSEGSDDARGSTAPSHWSSLEQTGAA
jgi:uncharacterized protein YbcI